MRIVWTTEEKTLITHTLKDFLISIEKDLQEVTERGWFAFYLSHAQKFLPEDRRRKITMSGHVPWLIPSLVLLQVAKEPETESPKVIITVQDFVDQNLDAVISYLQKTHVVVLKTEKVSSCGLATPVAKDKKVRVLIYGLMSAQSKSLSDFEDKLDLRFMGSEDDRAKVLPQADYAIGVTSFMNHSVDDKLQRAFKHRYFRVVGAVASVRRALSQISEIGKPMPAVAVKVPDKTAKKHPKSTKIAFPVR